MTITTEVGRDASPLRFERDGAIARIAFNRPEFGNTIDVDVARALMHAAIECDADDSIRCVVLTGTGKLFCAGGDIRSFAAADDAVPAYLKELTSYLHAAIAGFSRMAKPLVTSINGPAAGAGLSLAVLGDIALATAAAHFTVAYTAIGLSPDGGSTWLLPRLIGLRRTQELALLNRRVSAEEAVQLGLITRVVADGTLEAETAKVAETLAESATAAIGRTRNLLLTSFGASFETQMESEARAVSEAARGDENREGVRAFLEKRKPRYSS
jgi:2-(1,2-epoxy-1,2-dihydrophenyl)acetyl-CoA isomerase